MTEYIQIYTTTESRGDSERISRKMVENRLAACAQIIGPITSIYWWKSRIEQAEEWLCILKSTKGSFKTIEKAIKEIHPYEEPEIIAVPIVGGSEGYLKWLEYELKSR